MMKKSPYDIIKSRRITEKSQVLQELQNNESNACVRKCKTPKYVFIVDPRANKREIAEAVEEIYAEKNVRVVAVNTITVKPKPRRVRGRAGKTISLKKAIVTLEAGDKIEDNV
jgi:large subunit ribosomal protein L23